MREIYKKISESNFIEFIRCMNPFHGLDLYRQLYTDNLTGYPNGRAFIRDLRRHSQMGDVAIYTADGVGIKLANDVLGHDVGNDVIKLGAFIFCREMSHFGGKGYKLYGDDLAGLIENIDEETARTIPSRIKNIYRLINEAATNHDLPHDILVYLKKIPKSLQKIINLHVGYAYLKNGENIFDCLDRSREDLNNAKREFYEKHPELDPRKSNIIEKLRESKF